MLKLDDLDFAEDVALMSQTHESNYNKVKCICVAKWPKILKKVI